MKHPLGKHESTPNNLRKILQPELYPDYIKILKRARGLIRSKRHNFICTALLSMDYEFAEKGQNLHLRRWIRDMLGELFAHSSSYGTWLMEHYPDLYNRIYDAGLDAGCRAGRIQWIDAMIAKIEKEAKRANNTNSNKIPV